MFRKYFIHIYKGVLPQTPCASMRLVQSIYASWSRVWDIKLPNEDCWTRIVMFDISGFHSMFYTGDILIAVFNYNWIVNSLYKYVQINNKFVQKMFYYLSTTTQSDGVSFRLPHDFFSQHRLKKDKSFDIEVWYSKV